MRTAQYGPRRRPGARRTDAPDLGPRARCIAALRIDGGTAFGVWVPDRSKWNLQVRTLFERFTNLVDPVEIERLAREPPFVTLPLPHLPGGRSPGLAGVLEDERIDYRTRGFGADDGPPIAEMTIGGRRGKFLTLNFHDRAHVQIGERLDVETGEIKVYVRCELKHRELYADGARKCKERWLGFLSWLFFGRWTDVDDLTRLDGWVCTQLHVNSDFVQVPFDEEDESDFIGARKRELCGLLGEEDEYPEDAWQTPWVQTVNLGRKSSDVMVCIYRKGDQLREAKKLDPRQSAYAPLWRANGWVPEKDGDPTRVEFRLRKKGLQFRFADESRGDDLAYDFRDVSLQDDPVALAHLWRHVAHQRRLVQRTWTCSSCSGDGCDACDGTGRTTCTRIRRAPTDPRWRVVEAAANYQPDFDIRQVKHQVAELTRAERSTKLWRRLSSISRTIAMVDENLYIPHSNENLAAYFEHIASRLRRNDVIDYESTRIVPQEMDRTADFALEKCTFFSHELARDPRCERSIDLLEMRGAHDVSRAFKPPDEKEEDEHGNTGPPAARADRALPPTPRRSRAV